MAARKNYQPRSGTRTSRASCTRSLRRSSRLLAAILFLGSWALPSGIVHAYPLDATPRTGIVRLEGYHFSLQTSSGQRNIPRGSRLKDDSVYLSLQGKSYDLPRVDPSLNAKIRGMLNSNYSVALLDISDENNPALALLNEQRSFLPASVGKVLIAAAVFEKLRQIYPRDIPAREAVLKNSLIVADRFIESDTHEVPFWNAEKGSVYFRPIEIGDSGNLWTYLDWMLSASSNAAGSMVMKELAILDKLGTAYINTSLADRERIFGQMSPGEVARRIRTVEGTALEFSGLSSRALNQGSFFTKYPNTRYPSSGSRGTALEFLRLLLRIEQGRLVDTFSSLEIKKLLYSTQRRVRYASSPALKDSAVYYKSGSMYRCSGRSGSACGKYRGDALNVMNSIAIVEYPVEDPSLYYLVVVYSNELQKDSAKTHRDLGTAIHEVLKARHSSKGAA